MYFEFKFNGIHLYFLQIGSPWLASGYIAGTVIKEISETFYTRGSGAYAFEIKYSTQVTDPIMINELDKLMVFK